MTFIVHVDSEEIERELIRMLGSDEYLKVITSKSDIAFILFKALADTSNVIAFKEKE